MLLGINCCFYIFVYKEARGGGLVTVTELILKEVGNGDFCLPPPPCIIIAGQEVQVGETVLLACTG